MTLTEFKKQIEKKNLPRKLIWVDNCHTLVEHYLENLSQIYNRSYKKVFNPEDAVAKSTFDLQRDYTIYLLYLNKKDVEKTLSLLSEDVMAIAMIDEEISGSKYEQIVFTSPSKNACIVYLEKYLEKRKARKTKSGEDLETEYFISRDLLERALDYFDNNLDACLNEIRKVGVLELTGSWDHPFKALLDCLPKKDPKLRSLSWFSGGDIDTCQVLYNIYIKKLKNLPDSERRDQETWAKLVREALWCEGCIMAGLIGDYAVDYLRLVEMSLPSDFTIQYFPPVFFSELDQFPEWKPKVEEV